MSEQRHAQFAIYAEETAIPRYQRAWVWGVAALLILLCGLAAGWLFGASNGAGRAPPAGAYSSVAESALLARQEDINAQLRRRIAQLEQALAGDACGAAALKALTQNTR
ncbi:MAG: hypothetical protein IPK63_13510 [Candidatus Competibacteraceae bacterium]|nr:hypothetical protein [Candidatus Competibacteraceae bacterium]